MTRTGNTIGLGLHDQQHIMSLCGHGGQIYCLRALCVAARDCVLYMNMDMTA